MNFVWLTYLIGDLSFLSSPISVGGLAREASAALKTRQMWSLPGTNFPARQKVLPASRTKGPRARGLPVIILYYQ